MCFSNDSVDDRHDQTLRWPPTPHFLCEMRVFFHRGLHRLSVPLPPGVVPVGPLVQRHVRHALCDALSPGQGGAGEFSNLHAAAAAAVRVDSLRAVFKVARDGPRVARRRRRRVSSARQLAPSERCDRGLRPRGRCSGLLVQRGIPGRLLRRLSRPGRVALSIARWRPTSGGEQGGGTTLTECEARTR